MGNFITGWVLHDVKELFGFFVFLGVTMALQLNKMPLSKKKVNLKCMLSDV